MEVLNRVSFVEGEEPVAVGHPEGGDSPDSPEASVVVVRPPEQVLVGAVAEGGVGRHLAVAQLVIPALRNVEGDWSAPSEDPLALTIAERVHLRVSASAPLVLLASVKMHMDGINTGKSGQTRGSVPSFLIRPGFRKRGDSLFGEISHVVHCDLGPWWRRSHNLGRGFEAVSFVSFHLGAHGVHVLVVLYLFPVRLLGIVVFSWEQVVYLIVHY